jgi:hypothetical protein
VVQCASNASGLDTTARVQVKLGLALTLPAPTVLEFRICYDQKWVQSSPLDCFSFGNGTDNRFSDCAGAVGDGGAIEFDAAAAYVIAHAPGHAEIKQWWGKIDLRENTWPATWSTCNSFTYCP